MGNTFSIGGRNMKSVKEVLYTLKTFSELVVTLGYAAILQNDVELAMEATYIKDKIRALSYDMRISTIYAAKTARDSRVEIPQLASLLQVGVAAKEISDGIDDLVDIVIRGGGAHPVLRSIYGMEGFVIRIKIEKGSKVIGKNLKQLNIEKFEFAPLFIKKDTEYLLDQLDEIELEEEDIVLLKGVENKNEQAKALFK